MTTDYMNLLWDKIITQLFISIRRNAKTLIVITELSMMLILNKA